MLDMLCLAGEIGWARVSPRLAEFTEPAQLTPATPVALFLREHADAWQALRRVGDDPEGRLTSNARRVLDVLRARGASFFNDVRVASGLDAEDTRRGLGTLVASGLAASDGFSGLRALLLSASGRRSCVIAGRRSRGDGAPSPPSSRPTTARRWRPKPGRSFAATAWSSTGSWHVRTSPRPGAISPASIGGSRRAGKSAAGDSCWECRVSSSRCHTRSSGCARSVARRPTAGSSTIGTADPLNLAGIVTSGDRIRATVRNRVVYRDGVPVAVMESGIVRLLAAIDASAQHEVSNALRIRRVTTGVA